MSELALKTRPSFNRHTGIAGFRQLWYNELG